MKVSGKKTPSVSFSDPDVGNLAKRCCIIENLLWHYATTGVMRKVSDTTINDKLARSLHEYLIVPDPVEHCDKPKWYWTMDMEFID